MNLTREEAERLLSKTGATAGPIERMLNEDCLELHAEVERLNKLESLLKRWCPDPILARIHKEWEDAHTCTLRENRRLRQENERLRDELATAKAILKDNPDHADLDAAVFRINELEGRLGAACMQEGALQAEIERLSKIVAAAPCTGCGGLQAPCRKCPSCLERAKREGEK